MNCPSCGAANDDTAHFCASCGAGLSKQPAERAPAQQQAAPPGALPRVPSYMGWAIAVFFLCFWPTAIVAMVNAGRVSKRLAVGDITGAQQSSRKAKVWCWISLVIGIIAWVIIILTYVSNLTGWSIEI